MTYGDVYLPVLVYRVSICVYIEHTKFEFLVLIVSTYDIVFMLVYCEPIMPFTCEW